MDDTARLQVEIALLRARVDALQSDLLDLVTLHSQTLAALAQLSGIAPGGDGRARRSARA